MPSIETTTRSGKTIRVESPYSDQEAETRLVEMVENGDFAGNNFAGSLARNVTKYGALTPKQNVWAHILVCQKENPQTTNVKTIAELPHIREMMDRPIKLKTPTIQFDTDEFGTIRLKKAGNRSRKPGVIHVSNGGTFRVDNVYYGYIDKEGNFKPNGDLPEKVLQFLRDFDSEPEGVAIAYGIRSGNCCFCRQGLTTDESLTVGYGPICAKHYKLPWGGKKNTQGVW